MRPLWKHQVDAIRVAENARDLALFMEMGCGKSRTMIEILRRKYASNNRVMRTLILSPIIVCENWKREFALYSKIPDKYILTLTGTGADRVKKFSKQEQHIVVTNFEAMQMTTLVELIKKWNPEILICDESQRLKSHESKRAKVVATIADNCKHRYILTGTPILDGKGMDIFMQYRILDGGESFGKNFFVFRSMYFMDKNAGFAHSANHFPNYIPNPATAEVMRTKIEAKAIRVLKKDCLDLPPLIRQVVYASMSTDQMKAYREMKSDLITFIETEDKPKAVVAQLAITKALRLQQIVTGFVNDDEGNVHRFECPRAKVLEEILQDLPATTKVIVWACFKENYKQIAEVCDKLGRRHTAIHGGIDAKDREMNMHMFRTDPSVTVMIANQAAGGTGINLVEASYSIYYSKNFSLEADLQSESRNYRGGSEIHEKITRIDIVSQGTIDELILERLTKKQDVSENILTWYKDI
jgi:SNF2 family DNA or RNA helicase